MFNKRQLISCLIVSNFIIFIESNYKILKNNESIIHLKFFDNCFTIFDTNGTTEGLDHNVEHEFKYKVSILPLDTNLANDQNIEIFVLNDKHNHFVAQEEFGHLYQTNEFVLISINVKDIEKYSFVIEYNVKINETFWETFAFSQVLPFSNATTDGQLSLPVVDKHTGNLRGSTNVKYLVIRPVIGLNTDVDDIIDIKPGVLIGHRGTGVGRREDLSENILENTIEAFNYACSHRAEMIELDIQLSSDNIPIIYHDFDVKILMREKLGNNFSVQHVPVKDLSYEQMRKISTVENMDFDNELNQPFETLTSVLSKVDHKCGINFEIKYPQEKRDGTWDGVKGLDLNEYLDIIIKTLYESIGNRTGFITSFHPDLCAMAYLKQNKFSVGFLTSGDLKHWQPKRVPLNDPRTGAIPVNTYYAEGMGLMGLSVMANDLVANNTWISFIKSHNLSVYVWGDRLDSWSVVDELKNFGANGLIFDKIDKIIKPQTNSGSKFNALSTDH